MEEDETEAGLAALDELVALAEQDKRERRCRTSSLVIGLQEMLGGSDGFGGLTANPLVGHVAYKVAEAGVTPILTEIPEVFGAERLLHAARRRPRACSTRSPPWSTTSNAISSTTANPCPKTPRPATSKAA